MKEKIDRNLSLELSRVTEAAALAVARLMGRGEIGQARQVAAQAMEKTLRGLDIDGEVVIGEGRDPEESPHLYRGVRVGNGTAPRLDVAAAPVDGLRLLALGLPHAISIVAVADEGSLYRNPADNLYMNKIVVGAEVKGHISLDKPVEWNLHNIAEAKQIDVSEVTAVVLDRPRNQGIVRAIRQAGARLNLISDGDINGALMAVLPNSGIDVLMGIGGLEQAVLTACILKCLGGEMECRLYPRNTAERQRALALGLTLDEIYGADDLVKSENVFVSITGITESQRLEGVRYSSNGVHTHSLTTRSKSGTVRDVRAKHRLDKLMRYSEVEFLTPAQAG